MLDNTCSATLPLSQMMNNTFSQRRAAPVCISSRASTLPVSPATCFWASASSSSPPSPSCGCSTGTRNSTTRNPSKLLVSELAFVYFVCFLVGNSVAVPVWTEILQSVNQLPLRKCKKEHQEKLQSLSISCYNVY